MTHPHPPAPGRPAQAEPAQAWSSQVRPAQAWPAPPPSPREAWQPRPHPQLLRGPRHRWWRPLVGLAVVVAGIAVVLVATAIALVAAALARGIDPGSPEFASAAFLASWPSLLLTNLSLAALIPLSFLAVQAGHLWRPRWVSSVRGGLRWRWLALAAAATTAVFALVQGGFMIAEGWRPAQVDDLVPLLLVVLLTTPFQAAGEEYLFRGWLSQAVGSLFARAAVGAVVAGAVSALLFAAAHGGQNPWLFLDRFAFGVLASYLVWRTGGLEAAIALHAVNNVAVFVPTILAGELEAALQVTEAPLAAVVWDVALLAGTGLLLLLLARWRRVERLFVPPAPVLGGEPAHPSPAVVGPCGLG
ncbi:CPBP family intramembrane glutamic endopeptidase [Quadrisphaera sp. DSM 44207]|uniref:CPBP family intramembrane glutamic endopeptidase n=1 Tax=Quadrisphaera sp. DSM 44207 TaxID=1881057 RepID=UPI000891C3EB|nr:CPBP family intramembrane glutamic endopeptidase [Quadrisphaera sp. DSM 44207]SDQ75076.1 hypothetical protein SAMN05428996_2663 [Quadrisphaera sp. DSM 44207]